MAHAGALDWALFVPRRASRHPGLTATPLCDAAQLSLFPKKKNESTGEMESTFETIEEWVPPPPEEAYVTTEEEEPDDAD